MGRQKRGSRKKGAQGFFRGHLRPWLPRWNVQVLWHPWSKVSHLINLAKFLQNREHCLVLVQRRCWMLSELAWGWVFRRPGSRSDCPLWTLHFKRKWTDQKPTNSAKGASVSEWEAGPPEGLEPWDWGIAPRPASAAGAEGASLIPSWAGAVGGAGGWVSPPHLPQRRALLIIRHHSKKVFQLLGQTRLTPGENLELRGALLHLPVLHPHLVPAWLWLAVRTLHPRVPYCSTRKAFRGESTVHLHTFAPHWKGMGGGRRDLFINYKFQNKISFKVFLIVKAAFSW